MGKNPFLGIKGRAWDQGIMHEDTYTCQRLLYCPGNGNYRIFRYFMR